LAPLAVPKTPFVRDQRFERREVPILPTRLVVESLLVSPARLAKRATMVIYNLLLQFRLDRRLHFEQRL